MSMNKKAIILLLLLIILFPIFSVKAEEDSIYGDTEITNPENDSGRLFEEQDDFVTEDPVGKEDIEQQYYSNPETKYSAYIDDQANLLTEEEEKKLIETMIPLTKYGHIAFVSINQNHYSTSGFANQYYHSHFSKQSGSIFLIDMDNREIYIFSDGYNYSVITSAKAYSITDNIYTFASRKEYYSCADAAFSQMKTILDGGKILEPMRYASNIFIALTLSFFFSFLFVFFKSRIRKASSSDILKSCDISCVIGKTYAVKTGTHRVYRPVSDSSGSSGGGFSGGGGGGGSSGGGGGHSF